MTFNLITARIRASYFGVHSIDTGVIKLSNSVIPRIGNSRLAELAGRIKPLLPFGLNGDWYFELGDGDQSELWVVESPDLRKVGYNNMSSRKIEKAPEVEEVKRVATYHTTNSCFNPSVAEVLAQIPQELIDEVDFFQVVHEFPQRTKDFPLEDGGPVGSERYFEATTVLYRKK